MNPIHFIDALFFIVLPVCVIIYAIKYAWDDCKDTVAEHKWYRGEDGWFYCQNCGITYENTKDKRTKHLLSCPYHYRTVDLEFSEQDGITQSKTKGAYWCEGCYTWQLPAGHELHIDNCDCNY